MKLDLLALTFQSHLRAYAFTPALADMAADLQQRLAVHRTQRVDAHDHTRLKALALLAEYLDAFGRASEAAILLRPTAQELIAALPQWPAELADPTRRLIRQRVWCCASYAICLLRANRLDDAAAYLRPLIAFVDQHLAQPRFPCHGTIAILRYYQGLLHRNRGRLNEAAWDFDTALKHIGFRLAEKQAKHATDPDRLRREAIYSQVNTARVLGFGHGGVALSRGRYVEARAWTIAAQQLLAQYGQEMWRQGLEVYGCCAGVLIEQLAPRNLPVLKGHRRRLEELGQSLAGRNRRNATIAEAFAILAEVRVRQIRQLQNGESIFELNLDGLRTRLDLGLKAIYRDSGPLSATAALRLIGCLLRARDFVRCEKELLRYSKTMGPQEDALAEFQTLQAELWLETGREAAARALLTELVEQRPTNRAFRARAWALLAWCEQRAGHTLWADRALAAARESLDPVQDGFTKVFVDAIAQRLGTQTFRGPMPYQNPEDDPRWHDLAHNLAVARLNVVEAVHRRHPGYTVEKLAALMGRGPSWLYAFLAEHKEVEWVGRILKS